MLVERTTLASIFPCSNSKVLDAFIANPHGEFTLGQLQQNTQLSSRTVWEVVNELHKQGIVRKMPAARGKELIALDTDRLQRLLREAFSSQ